MFTASPTLQNKPVKDKQANANWLALRKLYEQLVRNFNAVVALMNGGTNGQVLTSNGGAGVDPAWKTPSALGIVSKFAATIGDGVATSYTVTHGLGTTDIVVDMFQTGGSKTQTFVEFDIVDANSINVVFMAAPALNSYRVIVEG